MRFLFAFAAVFFAAKALVVMAAITTADDKITVLMFILIINV